MKVPTTSHSTVGGATTHSITTYDPETEAKLDRWVDAKRKKEFAVADAIRSALDRVLAEDVVSPIDVPAHDNSAMDGYAFSSAALQAANGGEVTLRVIGTAHQCID